MGRTFRVVGKFRGNDYVYGYLVCFVCGIFFVSLVCRSGILYFVFVCRFSRFLVLVIV